METVNATGTSKKMFIEGQWCDGADRKTVGIINPATEEIIVDMAMGSRADTKRAIEAAGKAMPAWMKLTPYDRAKVLKKTADLMRERADAIAKTLTREQGKPLAEAKAEVLHSADTFEWFAEEGKRAYGQVIPNSAPGKFLFPIQSGVAAMAVVVVEHPRDTGSQQPVFDFKIPEPKRLEDDVIVHGRPPPSFTTARSARLQENSPPLSLKHPRE